ncbi:MAG: hypothetical protein K8H88_05875 [Sandaracinaceae bacterium]|nr:hypothetical protein [Sandaracinaceae bacterium]
MTRHVLLLIALLASACSSLTPSTGELGRARFVWSEGLACILGCDAAEAVAQGAQVDLLVTNDDDLPSFTASSEDASVLGVSHTTGSAAIGLLGVAPGSARVLLREAGGAELDRFPVRVRTADRLALVSPETQSRLLVMQGGTATLQLDLTAGGDRLVGYGAVTYALGGALTASQVEVGAIGPGLGRLLVGTATELAFVNAVATGTGTLDASAAGGASFSVPLEIVDASAVATITLELDPDDSDRASLRAVARAGDGEEIHGPQCAWTIDPPSGPLSLSVATGPFTDVVATAAGQATVTCTIGTQSASTSVSLAP